MRNISLRLLVITAVAGLMACQQSANEVGQDGGSSNRFMASMSSLSGAPDVVNQDGVEEPELDPINCVFNGYLVQEGVAVTAYQNSVVAYGAACVSETRTCTQGVLSGSYQYPTCEEGDVPADCLFNGATVKHGDAVTAYTSSAVAYGSVCSSVAETRTCNNGVLSGSAQYASCDISAARSCLFNGETITHGESVFAYQNSNVAYGETCTQEKRTCNDGTLSGSHLYGSCTVGQAASCLFDGKTIAHGQNVVAFKSSGVGYGETCTQETRTCDNGVISGSYQFSSCSVGQLAACTFNNETVAHGMSVVAYASADVAFGEACQSETRTCNNGTLSGSMTYNACGAADPLFCTFNGQTVFHGQTVTAFTSSSVPNGQSCQSETRSCYNGTLSGSAQHATCSVDDPTPAKDCTFNGQTVVSGTSVVAYQASNVEFGGSCVSESRSCKDGVLSGSYTNTSCSVQDPKACTLNGKSIAHGSSVTLFTSSSVPYQSCQSEVRTCDNGLLSGSATSESCVVQSPPPSGGGDQCQSKFIWEFPDVCRGNHGKGVGYFKSRISRDGGKTWMVLFKNRMPQDIEAIWDYMIQKNGENTCERPNVNYAASANRGYVVMDINQMPDCNVCKFTTTEESSDKRLKPMCSKKKEKVVKFLCGDGETKKGPNGGNGNNGNKDKKDDKDNKESKNNKDNKGKSEKK